MKQRKIVISEVDYRAFFSGLPVGTISFALVNNQWQVEKLTLAGWLVLNHWPTASQAWRHEFPN